MRTTVRTYKTTSHTTVDLCALCVTLAYSTKPPDGLPSVVAPVSREHEGECCACIALQRRLSADRARMRRTLKRRANGAAA